MATSFYCDICGKETRNPNELEEVTRDLKNGKEPLWCDICKECANKLFKPVKEYHTITNVGG